MAASTAQPDVWRLTVAAHDRPGLLAGLATVVAGQGLSISDASVWVLPERAIALHRVTAISPCASAFCPNLAMRSATPYARNVY